MKWRSLVAGLVVAALVTACRTTGGSGDDETGGTGATSGPAAETSDLGLPIIDPIDVDPGVSLEIAGSSTVFPLSVAVVSQWEDEGGPGYEIASIGSGGGLERFCVAADSDVANASRPINEDETAACVEAGREPIEIRVGTDALSVVISPGNTFATELTLAELATVFSLPAGSTWHQVNPGFPAHPIAVYSPGADSGTFDYFNEVVFPEAYEAEEPSPILETGANIVGEDDNVTVQGVSGDGCTEGDTSTTCAIGYFGYAYYAENQDVLVAVAVDGVAPSAESVADNSYPISRPLFMYTAESVIDEKPQVAEFIAYYLNNVNDLIDEVGYFPAPADALQTAADNIAVAAGW
jgi:phosphate binding protein